MPVRATKRGAERTPFPSGASYDVVICGASFAGLAVARELRATGARVLVLDRYEIGEKQTSACCAPTEWIVNLGLEDSIRQTFDTMVMHTMGASVRWQLPYTFSTFDYRELCELMWAQCGDAEFETAKVDGRTGDVIHTDRGDVRGELIVDALGWRRVLGNGTIQPPEATLSRGLEVHPNGSGLNIILEAWKGEQFSYHGKYYHFENANVSPRPYQLPHPPIRMAATTEETFPRVGAMGLPVFVGLRGMDIPELRVNLQAYRKAWQEAGHAGNGNVFLRVPVYAGVTEQGALEEPHDSIMYYFTRQANLQRSSVGRAGTGPVERRQSRAERLATLTYEEILHTKVAFGTAAGLIDRLGQMQDELGLDGIVAELNAGGQILPERVKRSLHILTHEVMPAFK